MIPSVVAEQIRLGIEDYLTATFPPESSAFRYLWDDFLQTPGGLFKGPYFDLKYPFRAGGDSFEYFQSGIKPDYPPYKHQERAFRRLCSDEPLSAIVATGTGSGKTECFLIPILEHCWRARGTPGVKAVVVYPMNALATDQARRFAREIFDRRQLRGLSVGLFVGGEGNCAQMTRKSVITDKNTMLNSPPDVLLTNYKELDYLLTRAKNYRLWRKNAPDSLRFVVVDELHTFDGAQGTDLACLLRRLYARLGATPDRVRRVGTSATLGDSTQDRAKLLDFASKVFGGKFDESSIITEDAIDPAEFLHLEEPDFLMRAIPGERDVDELDFERCASKDEYLDRQARLWFGDEFAFQERAPEERVALGKALRRLPFFWNLLKSVGREPVDVGELSQRLDRFDRGFSQTSERYRRLLFVSIFALISEARSETKRNDGVRTIAPFLRVRSQLWLREAARLVASVEERPKLTFKSDVNPDDRRSFLPLVHCRACGRIGFLSVLSTNGYRLRRGLDEIYRAYFGDDPNVVYVYFPDDAKVEDSAPRLPQYLCEECLTLIVGENPTRCGACKSERLLRVEWRKAPDGPRRCPFCEADELSVVGARAASLTSVAIGRTFASDYNEDKKLLAFSDSVQDASHRAGFFEGRTYRFNLRAAIQQRVERLDRPTKLVDLPRAFVDYWLARFGGSRARFVAQFIAPDLQNYEYDELREKGETQGREKLDRLFERVEKRVGWEIYAEYGFLSQIGRTLEKSGRSIVALDRALRELWIDDVWSRLREDVGELRSVERNVVGTFLLGFARNLRIRGGVCADCLNEYMKNGNSFVLRTQANTNFLPSFNKSRAPIFVQTGARVADRFDFIPGVKSRPSFYRNWLKRALGAVVEGYCEDVYKIALESGERLGLLKSVEGFSKGRAGRVWGLDPAALVVETGVDRFACDATNRKIATPFSEREYWFDAPDVRSDGRFTLAKEEATRNYYGNMYQNADVRRVVAREHTSLLERVTREKLERDFIQGDAEGRIGAPNALSCSPTLEMGIDVGDLSFVALCSMPPARSNFVQRVGRAGRRDGNATNLVVATNRPHDLYFYDAPEEMFAGAVDPPGLFLEAPAVLERQLTAYCFDRWIVDVEGDSSCVPTKLKGILDALDSNQPGAFPSSFVEFVRRRRDELFQGFASIFQNALDRDSLDALNRFFSDDGTEGGLERKICARLEKTRKLREDYERRLDNSRRRLKGRLEQPLDATGREIVGALRDEISALRDSIDRLNKKDSYNYFTDEGLLPNYAFPESGVAMQSVLFWRDRQDGDGYKTKTEEYERPARNAISEFAPGNSFYVDRRRLTIDRIDVSGDFHFEKWRFCGACSHVEKVGAEDSSGSVCPKCGSSTWGDGALKRSVLRLERVVANQSEESSRTFDEKDERDIKFFNRATTVEFPRQAADRGCRIVDDDFPFGFEYWRSATFREINFGEKSSQDGGVEIAGVKQPTRGFRVCRECGATQIGSDSEPKHSPCCKYYRRSPEKGIVDCVYLYREFSSEAIRVLLPLDDADFSTKIASFVAALHMGLKEQFGGSVDHLRITEQSEPIPESAARKRFLVLYDNIPGGTGYLKELASTGARFFDALQKARDKIRRCVCQYDEEKDGCYRCLLAYKVSRDAPSIRRSDALVVLQKILERRGKLQEIASLDEVDLNPMCESELEKRFVEALARYGEKDGRPEVKLEKDVCGDKPGYKLTVDGLRYELTQQVELGANEGTNVRSRADFVIRSLRNQADFQPIAVFTDGFRYHGDLTTEAYRVPYDALQRGSLVRSGKYRCWSLSYDDVASVFDEDPTDRWDALVPIAPNDATGEIGDPDFLQYPLLNAFDLLIRRLAKPDGRDWRLASVDVVLKALFSERIRSSARESAELFDALNAGVDSSRLERLKRELSARRVERPDRSLAAIRVNEYFWFVAAFKDADVRTRNWNGLEVALYLDDSTRDKSALDRFRRAWNSWLNAFNLLQNLPNVKATTARFALEGYSLPEPRETEEENDDEWREVYELADARVAPLIDLAKGANAPTPEVGFELTNERGAVVAEAELAWEERRVAVLLNAKSRAVFERNGWRVVETTGDDSATRALASALESF